MLKISPTQAANIGSQRFAMTMQTLLRDSFPEWEWLASEEAMPEIRRAIARALDHGLASERQCASFVTTWFVVGEDFDSACEAPRDTLVSDTLSADDKAQWLDDWLNVVAAAMAHRSLP